MIIPAQAPFFIYSPGAAVLDEHFASQAHPALRQIDLSQWVSLANMRANESARTKRQTAAPCPESSFPMILRKGMAEACSKRCFLE